MAQSHYITVTATVVLVVLHSTSSTLPRNTASAKVYPNKLQCKSESGCTSGAPHPNFDTDSFECDETKPGFLNYTNCHVLDFIEGQSQVALA